MGIEIKPASNSYIASVLKEQSIPPESPLQTSFQAAQKSEGIYVGNIEQSLQGAGRHNSQNDGVGSGADGVGTCSVTVGYIHRVKSGNG